MSQQSRVANLRNEVLGRLDTLIYEVRRDADQLARDLDAARAALRETAAARDGWKKRCEDAEALVEQARALRVAAAVALVVLDNVHTADGVSAARELRVALVAP